MRLLRHGPREVSYIIHIQSIKLSKLINVLNARGTILEYILYIHVVNQLRAGRVIDIWVRIIIAPCHWVHLAVVTEWPRCDKFPI